MDILDDQEFYELMQNYRHCDITQQKEVMQRFIIIKDFIREHFVQKEKNQ